MLRKVCPRCGGKLFLDFDMGTRQVYQQCWLCSRQFDMEGKPMTRVASVGKVKASALK